MDQREHDLIKLLLDRSEQLEARCDAAMYLAESDSPHAFQALLEVASDISDDDYVGAPAGESLAEILIRRGAFDPTLLPRLTPVARSEVVGLLRHRRPEWLA